MNKKTTIPSYLNEEEYEIINLMFKDLELLNEQIKTIHFFYFTNNDTRYKELQVNYSEGRECYLLINPREEHIKGTNLYKAFFRKCTPNKNFIDMLEKRIKSRFGDEGGIINLNK